MAVDPQISPGGRSVVVLLSRANFEENRYDTEIVLVGVSSRAQKVLTRRSASAEGPGQGVGRRGHNPLLHHEGKCRWVLVFEAWLRPASPNPACLAIA